MKLPDAMTNPYQDPNARRIPPLNKPSETLKKIETWRRTEMFDGEEIDISALDPNSRYWFNKDWDKSEDGYRCFLEECIVHVIPNPNYEKEMWEYEEKCKDFLMWEARRKEWDLLQAKKKAEDEYQHYLVLKAKYGEQD